MQRTGEPNLLPYLEGEFISLRPLEQGDFDSLFLVAQDPLIWDQHPAKRFKRNVFEAFFNQSIHSGGALVVLDRQTNHIIGSSRFQKIKNINNAIEIGWTFLARSYWGGKYNKALKKLMIDYALNFYPYVLFYVDQFNVRSQKAVLKLGATHLTTGDHPFFSENPRNLTFVLDRESWKG